MTLPKQFILAAIAVSFWMLFLPVTSSAGGGCSVPTAQFTASPTCVAVGGSVTFTDGSWPCSPATLNGWSWTFQGGTPGTYTTTVAPGNPPAITYTTAGTYDVSLTVTDTKPSTSGILTKTGYISVGPPVVAFSGSPATICPGGTVYFQDQSTGCPTSWSWTFTGGTPGTSTLQNPSVVYSTAGTYNVKLEIIGSFGTASLTKNLFITVGAPPVANFYTWPTTVCLGATVAFTDQSSYCPTSWSWTFPGGTPASSTAKNPSIVYSTAGTYSVTLMATNSFGSNTLSKTSYITVNTCPAPVAAFTGTPVTLCPGGTVSFTDNSTNTPTSWAWTFPGGTPGTSTLSGWFPAIGVVYNTAGVYDVTLTATNASGSNTLTKTGYITVSGTCAGNLGMNTTGAMANPSAILDISSTTQGMLIPRMTTAQRQLLKDPATGLIIYNTTSNAINFYNGSGWQGVSVNSVSAASAAGAGPGLGMAINATGNAADASATLDVSATDKGLLIPRIWPGSVAVPVAGLVIYNTGTNNINFRTPDLVVNQLVANL